MQHPSLVGPGFPWTEPPVRQPYGKAAPSMSKKPVTYKPGDKTPASGLYAIVGPRGGHTGESVVSEKGKPFPPTDEPGQGFKLDKPSGK